MSQNKLFAHEITLSFCIATFLFVMITYISFRTDQDHILSIPFFLTLPVFLFEVGRRIRSFYHEQFGKYEKLIFGEKTSEKNHVFVCKKSSKIQDPLKVQNTVQYFKNNDHPLNHGIDNNNNNNDGHDVDDDVNDGIDNIDNDSNDGIDNNNDDNNDDDDEIDSDNDKSKKQLMNSVPKKRGSKIENGKGYKKRMDDPGDLKRACILFMIRIFYSFTFLVCLFVIGFFTFETVENSYYGSRKIHNKEQRIVDELRHVILEQFCCPSRKISERELRQFIQSQLYSSLIIPKGKKRENSNFYDTLFPSIISPLADFNPLHLNQEGNGQNSKDKDVENELKKLLIARIDQLTEQTFQILKYNKGFEYDEEEKTFKWRFDNIPPINILKYHSRQDMHDRIQTFLRQMTKGFGLTHE